METILIVEDNLDVSGMLAETLEGAGYWTVCRHTGPEGLARAEEGDIDLVLLDIMLPYQSGDEVLRALRRTSAVPVIVISAKDMVGTKIDLLQLGADDYITKPFDLGEVTARVESCLRRVRRGTEPGRVLRYRDMVLDDGAKRAAVGETPLSLTAKEVQILSLLMAHPDKVFTKANLYESVWGEAYLGDDSTVKTHISNLRLKLRAAGGGDCIETVWGLGYRLFRD